MNELIFYSPKLNCGIGQINGLELRNFEGVNEQSMISCSLTTHSKFTVNSEHQRLRRRCGF